MQGSETLEQPLVIPAHVRGRGRRRVWLLIALISACAIGAGIFWQLRGQPSPTAYRTAPVERRTISRVVEAAGKIDVLTRIEIPAPAVGRVTELLVHSGDRVTRGQALARLDPRATSIAVKGAEAVVNAAGSRVAQASAELAAATDARERLERLLAKGLASPSELKQAEAAESRARAALGVARADRSASTQSLKSAELEQSQLVIVSPIDGVVLRALDAVGTASSDGPPVLFVVGSPLTSLRIDADVAESEIGLIHRGQAAKFSVPAYPGRSFDAKVEAIAIDSERSSAAVRYRIQLRAENPEGTLLPGMTATSRIEVARAENVLATREAALRFVPDNAEPAPPRSRLFRVSGNTVEPVRIKAGLSDGAFTEITPEPATALRVGSAVALGVATSAQSTSAGPGIKLGGR
jgi:HlyD family secretion protein